MIYVIGPYREINITLKLKIECNQCIIKRYIINSEHTVFKVFLIINNN